MTFDDHRWKGYVDAFHAASPGITEHVLGRARAEGTDAYRWCAAALGRTGDLVADVGCGSGPLAAHLQCWVGVDTSAAELDAAAARGRSTVARADVLELPFATRSLDAVVCSMALQVTEPLPDVLAEIARVLRPGGRFVALLPATRPLDGVSARVYLRLQAALQRRIAYPNARLLRHGSIGRLAAEHGLTITSDERRAFRLALRSAADARELLASLYLPEITQERLDRAQAVLDRRLGYDLAIPLRRLVMQRSTR